MVRYCDAFCGMGGFSLAAHQAFPGSQCVWAIDFDEAVSRTFQDNFGIDCRGDITKVDPATQVPDHDILFGGFPCQPFSQSGKWRTQVGEGEERHNLFLELVDILRVKRPGNFVFENVENLPRMNNQDGSSMLDTILWHIDDAGYDVKWQILDAKDYGVPQHRERIFFVGALKGAKPFGYEFPKPLGGPKPAIVDVMEPSVDDKYLIRNAWKGLSLLGRVKEGAIQPNHGFAPGTLRADVVQWIYDQRAPQAERTGETEAAAILYGDTPSGKARRTDKVYSRFGISPTVVAFSGPAVDSPQGLRMLTPRECARLQGFPDAYRLPASDHIAYKQVGNAVCVPVVAAVLESLQAHIVASAPLAAAAAASPQNPLIEPTTTPALETVSSSAFSEDTLT